MMKTDEQINIRNSIVTRLFRVVFSFYLVIAIGVTVAHMVMEYRYQKSNIILDLKDIQKTFEKGISIDMWQLNQNSLRSTVEGLLAIPTITGVKIQDTKGRYIAVGGIITQGNAVGEVRQHVNLLGLDQGRSEVHGKEVYNFDIFMRKFPVIYTYGDKVRSLGEVTIYSNSSVVFRRVKLQFLLLVINAFIKTAALWFIFLWVSNYLLRKPLRSLAMATKNISLENLESYRVKIKTFGPNELKMLEESFNSMIDSLHQSIVKRDEAEKVIRESVEEYRSTLNNLLIGVVVHASDTSILLCNPKAANILGLTSGQTSGKKAINSTWNFVYEDSTVVKAEDYPVNKVLSTKKPLGEYVIGVRRSDKNDITYVIVNAIPVLSDDGEVEKVIVNFVDITERKRAEEAVRRSEKLLNVTQRLAKIGGWEWNIKKETMFWTDEVYQIHDLHQGDLTTVNECLERSLECYDPEDRSVVMDAFDRCKENGEAYDLEFPFTTAKGRRIWIRTITEPVMEDGRIVKVVGNLMDITERKKAEEEQERLIEELEEKNAELERYTYTVSHDLRSPLVTINGFVSVLQEDALNGDTEQMDVDVNHIKTAIKKMSELLNDLLELSKIGRVLNSPQDTSLYDLTREVLEMLSFLVKEKNVKVNLSSRLPVVFCDRQRLGEVMQNLIENAVKYMGDQPTPKIDIGVRQEAQGCVIYVSDNGIGIEPRYNENIFGLFNQLDQSREGTGVGLAIVKRIVELHGGKVWVESEGLGKGTTFCFTLPGNDGTKQ